MNKALLYVRVSSKAQKDGYSLDAQERLGNEYAARHQLRIVKSWKVWESAWRKERIVFNQVVEYAMRHPEIPHIIFDVTDRMTRNDFDKLKIYRLIKEHGKTIHFSRNNKIFNRESGSDDEFMLDIEVAVAKKLSNDISKKTCTGMQEKAEQGVWPSVAPLGFLNNGTTGVIEPDPVRSPLFRRMFEMMSTGNYSEAMMSEIMYKEGLRNRKGGKCGKSAIHHFLTRTIYYGPFSWKGRVYQGIHTPLITKSLFDKVQAVLKSHGRPTPIKSGFHFNSLMLCGHCGCKVLGERKKRRFVYYHCSFSKGRHGGKGYVREERLSELFEAPVKAVTLDQETADWLKDALREENKTSIEARERKVGMLKVQQGLINNRISRLFDDKYDNKITEEAFVAKEKEYQTQLIEIKAQLSAFEHRNPNFYDDGCQILELSKRMHSLYVAANYEEKAQLLKLLASNYTLQSENDVTICPTYRKPFSYIAEGLLHSKWLPRLGSNQRQSG